MLNKITPEKFDRLMEQLLELGINTAEALKDTISLIFDKVRAEQERVAAGRPFSAHDTRPAGNLGAHVLSALRRDVRVAVQGAARVPSG